MQETQGLAVVLIDGTGDVNEAIQIAQDFDDLRPEVTLVLYALPSPEVVAHAMQAGVRDVLAPGADGDRVREAVKRALEVVGRHQTLRAPAARPATVSSWCCRRRAGRARQPSTNLAVGLANRAPKQVVLVDADLQFGDVGNALRLLAETSVRDAIAGGLHDVTEVKVHLTPHRSGLFALCAPDLPGVADEINAQAFTKAVTMLAEEFRFVVVDTVPVSANAPWPSWTTPLTWCSSPPPTWPACVVCTRPSTPLTASG